MPTYSTPGVYVEEIPKFPPSVAQVETAIPAFIGYTQQGPTVPTRLTSMLEFETTFGKTPVEAFTFDAVQAPDGRFDLTLVTPPAFKYRLYYAMQHFFANGGGPCYVISAGRYADGDVTNTALANTIVKAADVDEVTLLAMPDAALIADADQYAALMNAMLAQCQAKRDRFALLDVSDAYTSNQAITDNFRSKVRNETEFTKYGAAYYPYLETTLAFRYADAAGRTSIRLRAVLRGASFDTDKANAAKAGWADLLTKQNTARTRQTALDTAAALELRAQRIKAAIDTQPAAAAAAALKNAAADVVGGEANLPDNIRTEGNRDTIRTNAAQNLTAATEAKTSAQTALTTALASQTASQDTMNQRLREALAAGGVSFDDQPLDAENDTIRVAQNALYNALTRKVADLHVVLPPSAAVAGVYAQTDATRGVWKAPANVSLNQVVRPTVAVTDEMQGQMNVSDTGKSVNAIRAFTGRGILVWGARTLAGNDNEWRYVPVRRLFNMVEESTKKASAQFVFEPNDANTWTRIRAMMENFLFNLWRQGALAGAKPEHAYYVACGLGVTMTAQDILEGNLVVEIGMAAVRPAEFIVLRFSHKMQES